VRKSTDISSINGSISGHSSEVCMKGDYTNQKERRTYSEFYIYHLAQDLGW
jgi:hypothetical protein